MYLQLIACLCRSEIIMNNKGNQKHLTFEQRVDIEKGLTENKSFAEIGRTIGKDPSTISKEVRLHAHTKEHPDAGYTNPPCIHRTWRKSHPTEPLWSLARVPRGIF